MLDFTILRDSILSNVYMYNENNEKNNSYRKFDVNTGEATGANTSGDIVESLNLREQNLSTRNTQDTFIETVGGIVGGIDYVTFDKSKYNKITDKYDYDNINERLTNVGFRELETYKKQLRDEDYVVQYGGSNINNVYYLKRDEVGNDLKAGSNLSIEALKQIQDIKDVLGGVVGSNIEGSTAKITYINENISENNGAFSNVLLATQKLTRQAAKRGQDIKDFDGGDFGGYKYIKETDSEFVNELTETQKLTRQAAKRGQDIKDYLGGPFSGSNYIIDSDDAFSNVLSSNLKLTRQAAKRGQDIKDFVGGDFGGIKYVNVRASHTNSTEINKFEGTYDYGNRLSYLKYTGNTLTETLTRNELIALRNFKETRMTTNRTNYWTNNNTEATISEWNVDSDQNGKDFFEGSFPQAFSNVDPTISHNHDGEQVTTESA